MKRNKISQSILKEIIEYFPDTGLIRWRFRGVEHFKSRNSWSRWNNRYAGKVAGSTYTGPTGYKCIQLDILGVKTKAHRVAWTYMTGEDAPLSIDHIDRDGTNNRWNNLRDGSEVNNYNMSKRRDNKSGVTGVSWSKVANMWHARVWHKLDDKRIYKHLGYYKNLEEAEEVVKKFRIENGYSEDHGKSLAPYVKL